MSADYSIPPRGLLVHAQDYEGCVDAERLRTILRESIAIARSSKNPDTAHDRFGLAIEAYHQLGSLRIAPDERRELDAVVQDVASQFPILVRLNEAAGLVEKANKLKTPKRRLPLLYRARDALAEHVGAQGPHSDALTAMHDRVCTLIAGAESPR
jgi:hypothetical protein